MAIFVRPFEKLVAENVASDVDDFRLAYKYIYINAPSENILTHCVFLSFFGRVRMMDAPSQNKVLCPCFPVFCCYSLLD